MPWQIVFIVVELLLQEESEGFSLIGHSKHVGRGHQFVKHRITSVCVVHNNCCLVIFPAQHLRLLEDALEEGRGVGPKAGMSENPDRLHVPLKDETDQLVQLSPEDCKSSNYDSLSQKPSSAAVQEEGGEVYSPYTRYSKAAEEHPRVGRGTAEEVGQVSRENKLLGE
eukprot:675204-Hanusia_phi.AAC.22